MESEMHDMMGIHQAELIEAMEAQNTAIAAAQAAYAAAIGKSRQKLMTEIEARLSVWNGEPVNGIVSPSAHHPGGKDQLRG
jgi:hypothetical protein